MVKLTLDAVENKPVQDRSETTFGAAVRSHSVFVNTLKPTRTDPTSGDAGSVPDTMLAGHSGAEDDVMHASKSLLHTMITAYNHHHGLVLRPDDVWMAIQTQFSLYVQANAEALRDTFVAHEGKKELVVVGSGTLFSANYAELTKALLDEIRKNIKDPTVADWTIPDFSTTTDNDRVACSMVTMCTLQAYFDYKMMLMCGLPSVELLGTVEDWEAVRSRVDRLREFDLETGSKTSTPMAKWHALLAPVLDQFVETAKGVDNMEWWQRICSNIGGGSGPSYISGWASAFGVFDRDGKWQGDTRKVRTMRGDAESEFPIIETGDLPPGVVTCPVTVDDNGTEYKTTAFSGVFGFTALDGGMRIQPRLDWCLVVKKADVEAGGSAAAEEAASGSSGAGAGSA